MIIYQIFPRLAGPAPAWTPHVERAAAMGFDTICVNPLGPVGASRSLYALTDAAAVDPAWGAPPGPGAAAQVRAALAAMRARGLRTMGDLVLNHTAADAPLVRAHPEWYAWEHDAPAHPGCIEADGARTVWRDLARLDWTGTRDPDGLFAWAAAAIEYGADLGFTAFRCDAAYQVPAPVWQRLIAAARARRPDLVFTAETLGCTPAETLATARAGFAHAFNSAKWWDFESPWLLEQYQLTREVCDTIGFAESHDTPRLAAETDGWEPALRQCYLFCALFSAGTLMPIGFEYGFRRRLHVVETTPADWEPPSMDLTGFITRVNQVKRAHPAFLEDGPAQLAPCDNPRILGLWKSTRDGRQQALLFLNKDVHGRQSFFLPDPARLFQTGGPIRCVSPENPLDFVPVPFQYELRPGEAVVLVAGEAE